MRRWLKRIGLSVVALVILAAAAVPAVVGIRPIIGPRARALTDRTFESTPERLERGRYLTTSVSLCLACHSEIDWSSFTIKPGTEGSGRSFADEGVPFLTVPNITPDAETGAGRWTDDMLARAIREGIGNDGRPLFPLMPLPVQYMADEDLAAIVVYLRSLPPVRKQLPPSEIPFPVNRFINEVPEPVTDPYRRRTRTIRSRTATTWFASAYAVTVTHLPMRRARRFPAWSSAADFHSSARWEKSRAGTLPPLQAAFLITRKNSLSK